MARIEFVKQEAVTGKAKEAYETLQAKGKLSNMKQALLQDYATYDAFMGWYTSWNRLVEVVGERAATIYAHAISTTNGCLLCSLFFINDVEALGEDPDHIQFTDNESLLASLAEQIVKDPTAVDDALFAKLKETYSDSEIVVIVGFAAQMMATNNFNSVLQIDVDERLLPIREKFHPATWRESIR